VNTFQSYYNMALDGSIAITIYECCYAMWCVRSGKVMSGSLWEKTNGFLPKAHELRQKSL